MKKFIVLNEKGYPVFPIYFESDVIPTNAIEIDDDTERHYLSNEYKVNGEWVKIPQKPIPLDVLKQVKLVELKANRDTLESAPLNNFDVDSKSLSRIDIASKILATGTIASIDWTMADNTVKAIKGADFTNLYIALATRSNELHEEYRAIKEQINACTTTEALDAIKLNIGQED